MVLPLLGLAFLLILVYSGSVVLRNAFMEFGVCSSTLHWYKQSGGLIELWLYWVSSCVYQKILWIS